MFKYISQILNSLTPAQRILGLIFILCTITIITLGPSLINANTTNCEDLNFRVNSQNQQIFQLNTRITELNNTLLNSQTECTNRLVTKQKEILDIISQMENELVKTQTKNNGLRLISKENTSDSLNTMRTITPPQQDNKKMIKMIRKLKNTYLCDSLK
jgi:TolA-binding protein